ncbi:MAG: phosphatidate cytidylyltransferase [Xanthobacteraceae bacterium]
MDRHDPGANGTVAAAAGDTRNFTRRIGSAVVLAPIVIAAAYLGGWVFLGLCTIAAGVVLWEWTSLAARGTDLRVLVPGLAALVVAMAFLGQRQAGAAIGMIAIGTVLGGSAAAAWRRPHSTSNPAAWSAAGVVYAGLVLLGPAILRGDPQLGFAALLFLFATVWATDIFAYLVGRSVGGPLLWPALSPKKTWAGAIGGLVGGVAAGGLVAYASAGTGPVAAGVLGLVLSIVAQAGDLFESAVKRRFGAKDASSLIPGHGGVMDRLDGFLVAAVVAALIGSLHQGMAAPAQGLLVW